MGVFEDYTFDSDLPNYAGAPPGWLGLVLPGKRDAVSSFGNRRGGR
jgi:hypothetical protein